MLINLDKKRAEKTMSLGKIKLIASPFTGQSVSFKVDNIRLINIPPLCPHCLAPAREPQIYRFNQNFREGGRKYTRTIQFALGAHDTCSRRFRDPSISGSVDVRLKGDFSLVLKFREPLFASIFTAVNFNYLYNDRGISFQRLFDQEVSRMIKLRNKTTSQEKIICPVCKCGFKQEDSVLDFCSSCGSQFEEIELVADVKEEKKEEQKESKELFVTELDSIKCPTCDIRMLTEPGLTICGRCGQDLETTEGREI